jgi:hypothetical protein
VVMLLLDPCNLALTRQLDLGVVASGRSVCLGVNLVADIDMR